MKRALSFALLALGALGAASCAGETLAGRADGVRDLTQRARDDGAYRCAPKQLAMAETYLDLADNDMHDGDYFDAKDELQVADVNAKEAFRESPKEICNPEVAIAKPAPPPPKPAPPPPRVIITNLDTDLDGIPDSIDKCPTEPEDKDGFEDADGCPDPDNDGDGIPDAIDKCPNQPGPPGSDGCPQRYTQVIVRRDKIEILQQVFFDTDRARIKPVSYEVLNQVAQAMKDHPEILLVEVQGHTDSRGSHRHNMILSQHRAESVVRFLVKAGVDPSRLTPKGYGPDVPIADNRTAAGRQQNRRVEFIILKQENQ